MGLFDGGKSDEEKALEKVAKALDDMGIREADGLVHAGVFTCQSFDDKERSQLVNAVIEFLQKQGREIVDVKITVVGDTFGSLVVLVLYH